MAATAAVTPAPVAEVPTTALRLPEAVTSFGAAELEGWLYVCGGHTGRRHAHSRANVAATFQRIRLTDGVTEQLPAIDAVQGLALVAVDGLVIRIGGMTARNEPGAAADLHSQSTVAAYDPARGAWRELPALPEPRSSLDAATVGHTVYVVGGWSLDGAKKSWSRTCWKFALDDATPHWQAIAPLPVSLRALAVVAWHGKVWALGGMTDDNEPSRRVFAFDPSADAWSEAPSLPTDGFGIAAVVHGERMLLSPGDGNLYTFDGRTYASVGELAVPRFFHRAVVADQALWVFGGETATGHTTSFEVLPVAGAAMRGVRCELAVPPIARSRQGAFVSGHELMVVGGHLPKDAHDFSPEAFTAGGYAIDLDTMSVRRTRDLPSPAQSMVPLGVDADGAALLLGGFAPSAHGEASIDQVLTWAADGSIARAAAHLDVPRTQFGAVAVGAEAWLFGGTDYDSARSEEEAFRFPLAVVALPLDGTGDAKPNGITLPIARRAHACATSHGRVYLVGGMGPNFRPTPQDDVLDLAARSWSVMPSPSVARLGAQLLPLGDDLVLLGGTGAGRTAGASELIEVYSPTSGTWHTAGRLVGLGAHARAATLRGALVVLDVRDDDPGRAVLTVLHRRI